MPESMDEIQARYDENQRHLGTSNPHVRREYSAEMLEDARDWLRSLWEDTLLQTKGGYKFVCAGHLANVFDMAIRYAEEHGIPTDQLDKPAKTDNDSRTEFQRVKDGV